MTQTIASPRELPPRETFSVRFREQERRVVEKAALERGQRLSEYVRNAAVNAAREDLAPRLP